MLLEFFSLIWNGISSFTPTDDLKTCRTVNSTNGRLRLSHVEVVGNANIVTGHSCRVKGNNNKIKGDNMMIIGNYNEVYSNNCLIIGEENISYGIDNFDGLRKVWLKKISPFHKPTCMRSFPKHNNNDNYSSSGRIGRTQPIQYNPTDPPFTIPYDVYVGGLERKKQKQKQHNLSLLSRLEGEDKKAAENQESCIICFQNERIVVYNPCGHLKFCIKCTKQLISDKAKPKCPECRGVVESVTRVNT